MIYMGDYPASHTAVVIPFATFAASSGASSAASNFAASDILIYKNGGTTQRASASGITVSTSFDSQTGLNLITIDLSDNTDAGFYVAGAEYTVGVADITVDGQTVRFWAGSFSIERAGGALAILKAALSGSNFKADVVAISGDTTAADNLEAATDGTGYNIGNGSVVAASVTGNVGGNVTGSVGSIAAGGISAASIAADAITAAKIADGAIDAATFAAGAINAAAIADGAIDRATFAADTGLQSIRSNTAQAGAAGSVTLDASASSTTDFYKGCIIYLTGGTGAGQARLCTAYNGTTKVATVTPNWATNPDATSTFAVLPLGSADVQAIVGAVVSTTTAQLGVNAVQAGGTAWGSGAITAASIATDAITAAKIAADAIGASELAADAATEIATAVWASATRVLTAGTNIALAKGTGITGFNDLSAADVRTAVGLASANLDTQLGAIDDYLDTEVAAILAAVDTEIAAIKAKTDNLPAMPAALGDIPTADENAAALLDYADALGTTYTVRKVLKGIGGALMGKLSGAGTGTETIRDLGDTKDLLVYTVDGSGNRSTVVRDLT